MKKIRNNKGFTLVELLAVIVVLAIVMGLAVVGITSVLDSTRKSAFVADAKSFLDGAHSLVRADEVNTLLGSDTSYAPSCSGSGETVYIPVKAISLDQGGEKSPYGNAYTKGDSKAAVRGDTAPTVSYIKVTSTVSDNGDCSYAYEIYLTDGVYKIGPVSETTLSVNDFDTVS